MGKKRIVKKSGGSVNKGLKSRALSRAPKRKMQTGVLHIHATYNNTKVLLSDTEGNTVTWSSSGGLGFAGAKKGTPFAAAKVGELIAEKAQMMGVQSVDAVIKGVGAGRESALRAFAGKGIDVSSIADKTPVPFNGPRQRRSRRV
ncbi:30S ribosomal protein S11 [bacterium]|nr:30S ribosomal protein S11 [bacterium]|tara:strand:- start:11098 stop:11532 length:435 start_codon:yes stop_codon:yes gene_type:complete